MNKEIPRETKPIRVGRFQVDENISGPRAKPSALINHSQYGIPGTRGSNISELIRETRVIESYKTFIIRSELRIRKSKSFETIFQSKDKRKNSIWLNIWVYTRKHICTRRILNSRCIIIYMMINIQKLQKVKAMNWRFIMIQNSYSTRRKSSLQNLVLLYLFLLKVNRKRGYNVTFLEITIFNIKLWSY